MKIHFLLIGFITILLLLTLNASRYSLANAQAAIGCWVTTVGKPDTDMNIPKCETNDLGIPAGSVDGACTPTGEYPDNLTENLSSEYGLILEGYDEEHIRYIYELFRCLSGTRFGGLVYGTKIVNIPNHSIEMSCDVDPCTVWITHMPGRPTTFKFILTHELGHVIQYNNTREVNFEADLETANKKEGPISLYARSGLDCVGEDGFWQEDYADTIAYFLHPNAGETTPACDPNKNPPNPFFELNQFPDHVDVARRILLP